VAGGGRLGEKKRRKRKRGERIKLAAAAKGKEEN
jgi:hypothetical protein